MIVLFLFFTLGVFILCLWKLRTLRLRQLCLSTGTGETLTELISSALCETKVTCVRWLPVSFFNHLSADMQCVCKAKINSKEAESHLNSTCAHLSTKIWPIPPKNGSIRGAPRCTFTLEQLSIRADTEQQFASYFASLLTGLGLLSSCVSAQSSVWVQRLCVLSILSVWEGLCRALRIWRGPECLKSKPSKPLYSAVKLWLLQCNSPGGCL